MPQIAPVEKTVFFNGPLTSIFVLEPLSSKDGVTTFTGGIRVHDASNVEPDVPVTSVPALQSTFTISVSRPSKTSRVSKVRVKLVIPVAALDPEGKPLPTKSHENSADITYLFSEKSSLAERTALDQAFAALLGDSVNFQPVIRELKSMF